jgi:hypothetical protein
MKKLGFVSLAMATALVIIPSASATPLTSGSIVVGGAYDQWTSIDVTLDDSQFLDLSGYGWLDETGYPPTWSSFSISSTQQGQATGFDIAATAPEPSSLLLLGSGLLGIAFVVFRKAKQSRPVLNLKA